MRMASTSLKMLKRNRGQLERTRKQRTAQIPTPGSRVFVAGLQSPQPPLPLQPLQQLQLQQLRQLPLLLQPPQHCPHPLPLHQSVSPSESNSCNSNKPRREGLDLLHNSSSSNLPLNNNLLLSSSSLPLNNNLHLNSSSLPLNNSLHLNRVLPGPSCSSQLFSSSRHKVSF